LPWKATGRYTFAQLDPLPEALVVPYAEPFELDPRFLQSVRCPWNDRQTAITTPLRIVLRNGDLMYGRLVDVTDDHFVFDVRHADKIETARSAVRRLRQLDKLALIYDGPRGIEGWRTLHGAQRISDWIADESSGGIENRPTAVGCAVPCRAELRRRDRDSWQARIV